MSGEGHIENRGKVIGLVQTEMEEEQGYKRVKVVVSKSLVPSGNCCFTTVEG